MNNERAIQILAENKLLLSPNKICVYSELTDTMENILSAMQTTADEEREFWVWVTKKGWVYHTVKEMFWRVTNAKGLDIETVTEPELRELFKNIK